MTASVDQSIRLVPVPRFNSNTRKRRCINLTFNGAGGWGSVRIILVHMTDSGKKTGILFYIFSKQLDIF